MEWYHYVGAAVLILALIFLSIATKAKNKKKLPYERNKSIFNKSEAAFFAALRDTVQNRFLIAPKIGLKDFLSVTKGTPDRQTHFNRIAQKHIDFLLFSPDSNAPVCAIEIDGPSHGSERTKERDAFVQQVYNHAGLPLLRFPAKTAYTKAEITEKLTALSEITEID
jgi:hypothetical protein